MPTWAILILSLVCSAAPIVLGIVAAKILAAEFGSRR